MTDTTNPQILIGASIPRSGHHFLAESHDRLFRPRSLLLRDLYAGELLQERSLHQARWIPLHLSEEPRSPFQAAAGHFRRALPHPVPPSGTGGALRPRTRHQGHAGPAELELSRHARGLHHLARREGGLLSQVPRQMAGQEASERGLSRLCAVRRAARRDDARDHHAQRHGARRSPPRQGRREEGRQARRSAEGRRRLQAARERRQPFLRRGAARRSRGFRAQALPRFRLLARAFGLV